MVLPVALGARAESLEIQTSNGLRHGHASGCNLDRDDYRAHRAEMSKLALPLPDGGVPAPTFVKLDVEGSELAVLQGARRTLDAKAPPAWVIEVN